MTWMCRPYESHFHIALAGSTFNCQPQWPPGLASHNNRYLLKGNCGALEQNIRRNDDVQIEEACATHKAQQTPQSRIAQRKSSLSTSRTRKSRPKRSLRSRSIFCISDFSFCGPVRSESEWELRNCRSDPNQRWPGILNMLTNCGRTTSRYGLLSAKRDFAQLADEDDVCLTHIRGYGWKKYS